MILCRTRWHFWSSYRNDPNAMNIRLMSHVLTSLYHTSSSKNHWLGSCPSWRQCSSRNLSRSAPKHWSLPVDRSVFCKFKTKLTDAALLLPSWDSVCLLLVPTFQHRPSMFGEWEAFWCLKILSPRNSRLEYIIPVLLHNRKPGLRLYP